jgi:uncharacterized iron-regulated membrane protein
MARWFWVSLHRWAGLALAGFLIIVGVTGSLLAFYPELNAWLTPEFFPGPHPGKEMSLGALAQRAEELAPNARTSTVFIGYTGTAMIEMEAAPGAPDLDFSRIYLDVDTGQDLGRVNWGGLPTSRAMVMPFLYTLHYSLALGELGVWILGFVALVWTLDCFVGFYLTLPTNGERSRKSFFARWKPSWLVKLKSSFYRVNFDLHRAAGLWLWAMLLVYAWSSVYWNLPSVYTTVMSIFADFQPPQWAQHASPRTTSGRAPMGWQEANATAEELMALQAHIRGFTVIRPLGLSLMRERGLFTYDVLSDRDIADKYGATSLAFDASSGTLVSLSVPTGDRVGNTITTWLSRLHMADVFGLPYKFFVSVFGILVAMLSVTGVYIWSKKRSARLAHLRRSTARSAPAE